MSEFVHLELSTDDPSKAKGFYQNLFGWKFSEMPMPGGGGVYLGFMTPGGGPGGGIGPKQMPGQPTAWMPYVGVKSLKDTVEQARALGATVIVEHHSVGDMGALAVFADPTGAPIGLWEAAQPAKQAPARKVARKAAKKTGGKAPAKKAPAKKAPAKKAPAKKTAKKAPAKKTAKKAPAKKTAKRAPAKKTAAKK